MKKVILICSFFFLLGKNFCWGQAVDETSSCKDHKIKIGRITGDNFVSLDNTLLNDTVEIISASSEECSFTVSDDPNTTWFIDIALDHKQEVLSFHRISNFTLAITKDDIEITPSIIDQELDRAAIYYGEHSVSVSFDFKNRSIGYNRIIPPTERKYNIYFNLRFLENYFDFYFYNRSESMLGRLKKNLGDDGSIDPYQFFLTSYGEFFFRENAPDTELLFKSSQGKWFSQEKAKKPCDYPHQEMMNNMKVKNFFLKKTDYRVKKVSLLEPNKSLCFYFHHLKSIPGEHRLEYVKSEDWNSVFPKNVDASGLYGQRIRILDSKREIINLIAVKEQDDPYLSLEIPASVLIHEWGHNLHRSLSISDAKNFEEKWDAINTKQEDFCFVSDYAREAFLRDKLDSNKKFKSIEDVAEMIMRSFFDHAYNMYSSRINGVSTAVGNERRKDKSSCEPAIRAKICLLKKYGMIEAYKYPQIKKGSCNTAI